VQSATPRVAHPTNNKKEHPTIMDALAPENGYVNIAVSGSHVRLVQSEKP
jgi:hypothetical protein